MFEIFTRYDQLIRNSGAHSEVLPKKIGGRCFHQRKDYKIQTENFYMRIDVTVK